MTDKLVNPSVDNSGARGSALTPQQAAKECMARVFFRLESGECTGEFIPMRTVAEMEHEFTEIISQACDDRLCDALTSPEPVRRYEVTSVAATGPVTFSLKSAWEQKMQANLTSEKPEAVEEFMDLILGPVCSLKR